ncbi:hypothetical protein [Paenibacillus sp. DMB20]|uniref:hypothetical protein n=1 Tax=Paenibacillus sp. DMB20 TaxID=1642570 RepID=UPI000AD0DED3|nr:hypothetical protein [Paenibacillus sp. DMB20]
MNRKGVIVGSAVLVFLIAAATVVSADNGQSLDRAFHTMKSKLDAPRRENRTQPLENKS